MSVIPKYFVGFPNIWSVMWSFWDIAISFLVQCFFYLFYCLNLQHCTLWFLHQIFSFFFFTKCQMGIGFTLSDILDAYLAKKNAINCLMPSQKGWFRNILLKLDFFENWKKKDSLFDNDMCKDERNHLNLICEWKISSQIS